MIERKLSLTRGVLIALMLGTIAAAMACSKKAPLNSYSLQREERAPQRTARLPMATIVNGSLAGAGGDGQDYNNAPVSEKKYVRTAQLQLLVKDSRRAVEDLKRIALDFHGEIDKVSIEDAGEHSANAELYVRVPADRLEEALGRFSKVATKVTHESIDSSEVTRRWVDEEARLRTLRATEQQYLVILKSAHSVNDVLQVTEKLQEVRGEIESTEAAHRTLKHDVEMSAVAVNIRQSGSGISTSVQWEPWLNVKRSWQQLKIDLADWADSVVAFFVTLPAILLWVISFAVLFLVAVRALVWFVRRFLKNMRWPWRKGEVAKEQA